MKLCSGRLRGIPLRGDVESRRLKVRGRSIAPEDRKLSLGCLLLLGMVMEMKKRRVNHQLLSRKERLGCLWVKIEE